MAKENVTGAIDKAVGKVKQKAGEAVGNQKLANEGTAQQVKGSAKEALGSTKDTVKRVTKPKVADAETSAAKSGDRLRDKIAAGAEHVKDTIQHGLGKLEHPNDRRDIRQVQ